MTTPEARLAALKEALLDGSIVSERLSEAIADVEAAGLLSADRLSRLEKPERRAIESLALNFTNFAGIIHDQVIRLIVTIEEGETKMTRRDRRNVAEALGLIEAATEVEEIAEMRNRIAHQYPRDPDRQQRLLSGIIVEGRQALVIFQRIKKFSEERYFNSGIVP